MYRILTEDVNRESIYSILDARIDGYTVTSATGSWKGRRENSLAVDIVGIDRAIVFEIAESIKAANKQESVLILEFASNVTFI